MKTKQKKNKNRNLKCNINIKAVTTGEHKKTGSYHLVSIK